MQVLTPLEGFKETDSRGIGLRSHEGQHCGIRASLLRFGRLDGIRVK